MKSNITGIEVDSYKNTITIYRYNRGHKTYPIGKHLAMLRRAAFNVRSDISYCEIFRVTHK